MDLQSVVLSEISQTKKDKCHIISKKQNKWTSIMETDLENIFMVARLEDGWRDG